MNSLSSLAFAQGNAVFFSESDDDQDLVDSEIDDSIVSEQMTWSSKKINERLKSISESKKYLTNVTIPTNSWVDDAVTFTDYPHKSVISVEGITEIEWICKSITPDHTDRTLDGLFCPYVYVGDGSVTIWVSEVPDHAIVLENIVLEKVV